MYLDLGGVSTSIEVDDDDPSMQLLDLVQEAADPDDTNQPNEVQQLAQIIDAEYAELFNQVCADVIEDMKKAVSSSPEKSKQLNEALDKAEKIASRNIGNQNEIV